MRLLVKEKNTKLLQTYFVFKLRNQKEKEFLILGTLKMFVFY